MGDDRHPLCLKPLQHSTTATTKGQEMCFLSSVNSQALLEAFRWLPQQKLKTEHSYPPPTDLPSLWDRLFTNNRGMKGP